MSNIGKRTQIQYIETEITDEFIKNLSVLVLVQGVLENGQPHYAYASIPKDKYRAFKQAEQTGTYNLSDFGKILHHGEGLLPPEDIVLEMQRHYGADHQFEERLIAMARAMDAGDAHTESETKSP